MKAKIVLMVILTWLVLIGVSFGANAQYSPDTIITSSDGFWLDSRAKLNLSSAVTAIGSDVRDLVIAGSESVSSDLIIPATTHVRAMRGCAITVSAGKTLTINDLNIDAGDNQIFFGTGNIDFANGAVVRSTWFGSLEEAAAETLNDTITLIIAATDTLIADLVIGDDVSLMWESEGALINVSSGTTLSNINNIFAGSYTIFGGTGNVSLNNSAVFDDAWGTTVTLVGSIKYSENSGDIEYPTDGAALIAVNASIESAGIEKIVKLIHKGSGVSTPFIIASDTVFSEYMNIQRESGAIIHVNSGVTLDMGGSKFTPDLNQLFAGPGTIIGDFECSTLYPQMFGAVADALYFDSATSDWYSDAGFSTEATDDTTALNKTAVLASYCGSLIWLRGRYLVDGEWYLPPSVCVDGDNPTQQNAPNQIGSALCAGWDTPSVFQSDSTWSNSVIRIDNCTKLIGGNTLRNFAVFGSTDSPGGGASIARAPRTAISQRCGLQGKLENLFIINFTKAGICSSASQDQGWDYLTILACGTNESGEDKVAALEFLPNTNVILAGAAASNAIHVWGMRMAHNRAWLHMDGAATNLGEFDFNGCKFELKEWLTYEYPPFLIKSGIGAVAFTGGTHFTVNGDLLDEAGDPQYLFQVDNYQTRFGDVTFRGEVRIMDSNGLWIEMADIQHKSAPTHLTDSLDILKGKVSNYVVNQNLSGVTSRSYMKIGSNAIVDGITFMNFSDATTDIIDGTLITVPDSDTSGHPIVTGLSVYDDDSGYRLYHNTVLSAAPSFYGDLAHATIEWADSSKIHEVLAADTLVTTGVMDAPRTPERVVLDYGSPLTISRIGYGTVGQIKSISISSDLETAGGVTITDGFYIQTSTGADLLITDTADARAFECLDGTIWREVRYEFDSTDQTNLTNAAVAINTVNKYTGKMVWDTTNNKPVYAVGPGTTDVWVDGTGATAHTPI